MDEEPRVKHIPKSAWMVMPPAPDRCQVCAGDHTPEEPHNPQSLYWQTKAEIAGEPAPTWEIALAHVKEPLRSHWVEELRKHGVEVS